MKNTKVEVFRDVVGHEDKYEVSNLGTIRTKARIVIKGKKRHIIQAKIRKPVIQPRGYLNIQFRRDNKTVTSTVHRVHAEAWLHNKDQLVLTQINHIDGNKLNNTLENYEWVSPKQNMKHARETGLNKQIGESHTFAKLEEKHVLMIRSSTNKIADIARLFKVSESTISSIRSRTTWKHI